MLCTAAAQIVSETLRCWLGKAGRLPWNYKKLTRTDRPVRVA